MASSPGESDLWWDHAVGRPICLGPSGAWEAGVTGTCVPLCARAVPWIPAESSALLPLWGPPELVYMDVVNKETYFWKTNQNLKSDIIRKVLVKSKETVKIASVLGFHQNAGKQAREPLFVLLPTSCSRSPTKALPEKKPVSVQKSG